MTIEKADELVTLVCDHLCHHPFVMTQEELDEKCESCPLAAHLMKDVQESPALIVPEGALSEENLTEIREAMQYGCIMASGEEPTIEFVQQGWISVTDRLPDKEFWEHQKQYADEDLEVQVMIKGAKRPTTLFYNDEGEFYAPDGVGGTFYLVTHWAPLLEPPKEEHHE